MSVAQQPGPGHAPDVVARLRWALAATGLALVVVLALLAAVLLSIRRARLAATAASQGIARIAVRVPVRRSAPIRTHAGRSGARPRRAHGVTRSRPRVEIVERRAIVPPATSRLRPPEPLRPHSVPPRARQVLGERWTMKPAAAPPPTLAVRPPLIMLPDAAAGEVEAPESPPEPLARSPARYPEDAAADGVTGSVRLKVVVSRRGRVEGAVVVRSSGDDRLDQAAEAAVRRWRYRPARRNGRSVTAVDYAVIEFYREACEADPWIESGARAVDTQAPFW